MNAKDKDFAGSIPALYDELLVPLMFQDYARDLAARVAACAPATVLETAAGTGAVTRELRKALPDARLTATDLNPAMLARAASVLPGSDTLEWLQADAQRLPFDDHSFDAMVCAFGVMFFPDRPAAYREARRVLAPGGRLALAVWDSLANNPLPRAVAEALAELGLTQATSFLERVPFSLADPWKLGTELEQAGFSQVRVETVAHESAVTTAGIVARSHVLGTPTLNHVEADRPGQAEAVSDAVATLLARNLGEEEFRLPVSALLVTGTA
ncbi:MULTISPECIES: methyltransferase domain-containing protein [Arthrobacter]|uniref:Methyltransferase domain-containing protein n=2 Tax=Arthrobacter TaxID=1663 RepID=A0ABU9KH86_9MICC|nr:methyltransferase domain-containing protein [Arthrobacter sp. YJM1]MDP5226253.1 methyltransferase domain-containing protein [Arthrobacter sp. YJM1]